MNSNIEIDNTSEQSEQLTIATLTVNHTTAPINIREALAFEPSEASDFLKRTRSIGLIKGGVLLSTCNRMSLFVESSLAPHELKEHLGRFVLEYKRLPNTHNKYFEFTSHEEAIHHLFYLASGYLSMVRGETQILGQIKEAVQIARTSGNSTNSLLRLFDKAYEVAKKVRSSQQIFAVNKSAGSAAVTLLADKHGVETLQSRKHLILGAGQMAVTLIQSLRAMKINEVRLYNRTPERAEKFGEAYGITDIYSEDELNEAMTGIDYIWVATSASSPIITRTTLVETIKDLSIFDLGLPRNVSEDVGTVKGVQLYCLDDLDDKDNPVSNIIPEEVVTLVNETTEEYLTWLKTQQIRDVYSIIKDDIESFLDNEYNKVSGLDEETMSALKSYNKQLLKAYSSTMIARLRHVVDETKDTMYADALKKILTT
ncbi:glutamyl-tRNA reductase [Porphyromonadaceae bacterium W3.11]|nr:glutamyl-tRNA reductase [Porphyromonadaceae bacterium W3.11]